MHYLIFLVLVGVIFVDGSSLVSDKILGSDLEGVISLQQTSHAAQKKNNGFLQYGFYELPVHQDKTQKNTLVITCANEGSKCKYYDVVEQTWKTSNANKIYFNGEQFFDMVEVIRVYIKNRFLLLLTMEKEDRQLSDNSFLVTYKVVSDFLREDREGKIMDLKAIYVDDSTPDHLKPHSMFQSVFLIDARLKTEGESVTLISSSGIVKLDKLLAIRELEVYEYLTSFSRQKWRHTDPNLNITTNILKKDLATLDPNNQCRSKALFLGFLEYNKDVTGEVRCEKKKYGISTRIKYFDHEYDVVIKCPVDASSGKNDMCVVKENSADTTVGKYRKLEKTLSGGDRFQLVDIKRALPQQARTTWRYENIGIVHYFQLDDVFKMKLQAMQKMLALGRGSSACREVTLAMPSVVRRDFTIPLTLNCDNSVEIGGHGAFDVLDDEAMKHFTVEKLTLNLETNEFDSPDMRFKPGNPVSIRYVGEWESVPLVRQKGRANVPIHYIMEDLKELHKQYLEAAAVDPQAKRSLEVNSNVLLVMHGETTINDMKAVTIKAVILCRKTAFTEVYFTGEKLVGYDALIRRMRSVDPMECLLKNENLPGEDYMSVDGLTYVTEDGVVSFMKPFTSSILGRCQWLDNDTVFRFVIHDSGRWSVVEGLFHCSLQIYLLKGPFKVLGETASSNASEDILFVFLRGEVLVTNTNAFAVRMLDGRTVDESLLGPRLKWRDDWDIALQRVPVVLMK